MAQKALDTFSASPDGIPVAVTRGQVLSDNDPLVRLDRSEAARAQKEGRSRAALFAPWDVDEEEPPPGDKPPKTAPARGKGA